MNNFYMQVNDYVDKKNDGGKIKEEESNIISK